LIVVYDGSTSHDAAPPKLADKNREDQSKIRAVFRVQFVTHARTRSDPITTDTGNESVPIQLAQCRFWPFPALKYKCIFQMKYAEAILSNSTRNLSRFEITEMLPAV